MAKKKIEKPLENTQKKVSQKKEKTPEKNTKKKVVKDTQEIKEIPKENPKPIKRNPVKENKERPLTIKEKAFCREYIKHGNGLQAVKKAGYKCKNDKVAGVRAARLVAKGIIQTEIQRLMAKKEEKAIASAQDVMEFFTRCMMGEEKDQFGLDISAADKIKAAIELAKRTVDIDNRVKGVPDASVTIKLDWKKE